MTRPVPTASRPGMGQQPGLDGLRAICVIAVMLYHGGFTWIHGGFLGVEVFFVVSGFLITTLLIEEREKSGRVSLPQFWLRRARRLFPALFSVLLAVAIWAALFGSTEQTSQMRRDLPWSIFYFANWGTIVGDVPYFQPGDPPLLRHLWSLAVEEQWYLMWPLAFVALAATGWRPTRIAKTLFGVVGLVLVITWWIARGDETPLNGLMGWFDGDNRVNFMYLSTVTRSSGLLMGAAAAFVWRPWRSAAANRVPSRRLDLTFGVVIGLLMCCFIAARLTEGYMYPWVLGLVSGLSLIGVLIVVHPAAKGARYLFSLPPIVEIGKRSYGLYLWHWPILVIGGATKGSLAKFVASMAVAAVLSEVCYRYIETPVRKGALGRWWHERGDARWMPIGGVAVTAAALAAFYVSVEPFDVAAGGEASFELSSTDTTGATNTATNTGELPASEPFVISPEVASTADNQTVTTNLTAAATPTTTSNTLAIPATPPVLPRAVTIVGDSQAHSLAINLPDGIGSTFAINDGSLDGCSIYESGRVHSSRDGFSNNFSICADWVSEWGSAAAEAEVAVVVIGAWDVFDIEIDGVMYPFASAEFDQLFIGKLQLGIEAMAASGAQVGLLEVACMRPQDVEGAGVPALPERADDSRVAHLNDLLRGVASGDPARVTFVEGPDAWCGDPVISADLGYRWDGVHVYKPGAKLIYETIAPALLAIPVAG
jgi:peptidoglycan/LPS O-acetylase OafA/YrhL